MAVPKLNNVYVGERYIPKWEGPWDSTKDYEGLCIVSYNNSSYVSRRPVPAGTALDNETYWALMSNFGGQLQVLQEQVDAIQQQIDDGEIGGGSWTNAESLGIKPGIDIGPIVNALPATVTNIAFPAGNYSVGTACTFKVPVYFAPGAQLLTNAQTTFTKPITAGRYLVFPGGFIEGQHNVTISNDIVLPEWFGWNPDNNANSGQSGADAMFAAITDACVSFGAGTYNAGTPTISFDHNVILRGVSQDLTKVTLNLTQASVDYLCLMGIHLSNSTVLVTTCTYFYANECIFDGSSRCIDINNVYSYEMSNCDTTISENVSNYFFFAGLIARSIMRITSSTFTDNTSAALKNIFSIGKSTSVPNLIEFTGCSFSTYLSCYVRFFNLPEYNLGHVTLTNCNFENLNENATAPNSVDPQDRAYYSVIGCTGVMPKFPTAQTSLSDCVFTVMFQEDLGARFNGKATNCVFIYPLTKFVTNVKLAGAFVGCTFIKQSTVSNSLFHSDNFKASLISCSTSSFNGLDPNLILIDTPLGTGLPIKQTVIKFYNGSRWETYNSCGFLLVPDDASMCSIEIYDGGVLQNIVSAVQTVGNSYGPLSTFGTKNTSSITFTASQVGSTNFKVVKIAYGQELSPEYVTIPIKAYNSGA